MVKNQREPKSAVDLLEHVTDGGVHVDPSLLERSSSRESMLGGVINEEAGSTSRYLESQNPRRRDRS
jgi:hypothetical protein